MRTYYVDGWALAQPGHGGWQVKTDGRVISKENYPTEFHSINFYELEAIASACCFAYVFSGVEKCEIYSDSKCAIGWTKKDPSNGVIDREALMVIINKIRHLLTLNENIEIKFWDSRKRGENPADFGRKRNKKYSGLNRSQPQRESAQ